MNHHPAFTHQSPILGGKHDPAPGRDDLMIPARDFGQNRRLASPKTGLPFKFEDQIDGSTGAGGNELIKVHEPEPEFTSERSPNGALAGAHGANQEHIGPTGAYGVDVVCTHARNASIGGPLAPQ